MAIQSQIIDYQSGDVNMRGFFAYDDVQIGERPAVLIAHTWEGRGAFVDDKALKLAELGYAAFAIDLYGDGKLGANPQENEALMTPLIQDRMLLRTRLLAGLDTLRGLPEVNSAKMAAIGYCFGGLCVLDLARSETDLLGVVSFHGLLIPPEIEVVDKISAKVLVLHGHDDPMVPPDQVNAFKSEMTEKKADWQVHCYGHTMHGFSSPLANMPDSGIMYNADAARRSWLAMQNFFDELL